MRKRITALEREVVRHDGMNICSQCQRILPLKEFVKSDTINVCLRCNTFNVRCSQYPGLTPGLLMQTFEKQGKRCLICRDVLVLYRVGSGSGPRKDAAVIDHCHVTGKFRGIICTRCNIGIGYFENSPERLRSAAEYIEEWNTSTGQKRVHKQKIQRPVNKILLEVDGE